MNRQLSGRTRRSPAATLARWAAAAAGLATGAYSVYVASAWMRYGHPSAPAGDDADALLDSFMPAYDVAERHYIRIDAPAEATFAAACEADLTRPLLVRSIFRAREILLGSRLDEREQPRGLVAATTAMGWGVLAETSGREIVMGAVTRPWEANVVFRALPPAEFAAFCEPGYVKIAWTLRADPGGPGASIFRTETRAVATDHEARIRFRRYWSFLSPGIILIRWMSLRPVKADAEERARASASVPPWL